MTIAVLTRELDFYATGHGRPPARASFSGRREGPPPEGAIDMTTKIIFIQNIAYPHIGVMSLSAVLRKGGYVVPNALIGEKPDELLSVLKREEPQLVGFPVMTGMHLWARKMSALIKEQLPANPHHLGRTAPHVHAGRHPRARDRHRLPRRGRGRASRPGQCHRVEDVLRSHPEPLGEEGRVHDPPERRAAALVDDLDSLPFPDRELYRCYPKDGSSTTQVLIAGRGCPFDCTYCFNHEFRQLYRGKGRMVRYRSVRNLLDEIRQVCATMKVRHVYLNDDTLILNRKWVMEFTDAYPREVKIPFACLIRADLADGYLIRRMAKAGCRSVFFGIEPGNEKLRNGLLKKKVTDEEIIRTAQHLKKYRIRFRTYNMLGLPGETLEDAIETLQMNIRIKADFPWASVFMPYPGTELGDLSRQMGLLDPTFGRRRERDVPFILRAETAATAGDREPSQVLPNRRSVSVDSAADQAASTRLPPNKLFVFWFTLVYGYFFIRSESRGCWETIWFGLRNLKHLAPSLFRGPRHGPTATTPAKAGA